MSTNVISQKDIEEFMNGYDPMERIVNLSYNYQDNYITVFYRDKNDIKQTTKYPFYPFLWATLYACKKLCMGNRKELVELMKQYNVGVIKLSNIAIDGSVREEFEDGYMFMFYAKKPMPYSMFLNFFKAAKNPVYPKKDKDGNNIYDSVLDEKQYLNVTPQEQFLISSGKRFFKGYDDYNQILRMSFDLETEGLDTEHDRIKQLGIQFNRPFHNFPNGFKKIFSLTGNTKDEKDKNELEIIKNFFRAIKTLQPDVVCGHNIENFDINMLIGACKRLGTSFEAISEEILGEPARKDKKTSNLKLGGEMEKFYQTIIPGVIVTDSLHAVRRAQALDSNMMQADLKYATKYAGLVKQNRVYTPGNKIDDILTDTVQHYAFNNTNGDWYIYDPSSKNSVKTKDDFNNNEEYEKYLQSLKGKQGDKEFKMRTRNVLMDGYTLVTGKYIIERYLYDDIWEGDKVEWKFNSTNFLICKMLPIPYKKCTIMGTAGQWKSLMMAWSFKHHLAIPKFGESKTFTGGLSRLLRTGYAPKVIKLDYNSLYPSIILTWGISDKNDLLDSMLKFLEYVLTTRETYKKMKKDAEKRMEALEEKIKNNTATFEEKGEYEKATADFALADGKQMQMKCLGNSFFGSYGAPNVFPFGSLKCAEQTTCTGRQCLRLMISHFSKLGYTPIVGDSVTGDTPLFIKYNSNELIDILPISKIFDTNKSLKDGLNREYDKSEKDYKVLCRSGWITPSYVYRHKTKKDIYLVKEGETVVEVTEDHSLFNDKQEKIKPSEITNNTTLEYNHKNNIYTDFNTLELSKDEILKYAKSISKNEVYAIPYLILNSKLKCKQLFISSLQIPKNCSKTVNAGINYINKCLENKS